MSVGFQTLDGSGGVITDLGDRIAKFLGSLNVGASYNGGAASGSITDARLTQYAGTTPWFGIISSTFFRHEEHPVVTISGNTLSWSFPSGSTLPNTTIIYGLF
jgi:hypothetical protein